MAHFDVGANTACPAFDFTWTKAISSFVGCFKTRSVSACTPPTALTRCHPVRAKIKSTITNEERLHAALGYMTPATWHRGQPNEVRDERARRIAAARARRKTINQQRWIEAA